MKKLWLLCLVVLLPLKACDSGSDSDTLTMISGPTMGTEYLIKIADKTASSDSKHIKQRIDQILHDVNQSMSTYIDDSELSVINQNHTTEWIQVSKELLTVILEANRISAMSDGAFDITVGPLVNLWGFGASRDSANGKPDASAISQMLNKTGYLKLEYQQNERKIRKQHEDLYLDLSAIAKGFAVDLLANELDKQGYKNFMVEIGGEIKVKGRRSNERGWRIGVEKPVVNERSVQKILELKETGMATSGDYRNYKEIDGQRYSHTINPQTGSPITHKLASVSVLHKSTMTADALATALNVLGPDKGVKLAEEQGITALFLVRTRNGFKEIFTHHFDDYFVENTVQ